MKWLLVFSDHQDDRPPTIIHDITQSSLFDRFEDDMLRRNVQIFNIDDAKPMTRWCYDSEHFVDVKTEIV